MLRKQAKYPCYISEQVHIRSNGDSSSSSNSSTENRALFDAAHAMYKKQVTTLLCCVLVHHGPHCPGLLLIGQMQTVVL